MKALITLSCLLVSTSLLSACATSDGSTTPSLSAPSRQTSRQPSPSNFQRNNTMDASRMTLPQ